MSPRFWEKPLTALNPAEWEALCDGCGKCCLHKVEDEDTGRIYFTNVACRLLDLHSTRCSNYSERASHVPDCVRLTQQAVHEISWLPRSCAYRLRAEGEALPDWHYLICGDREAVHAQGHSVRGWAIAEAQAGEWEDHLLDHEI
ncbi:MAG: YcgN family cysteine cluster protein [Sphingobium sp.]